MNFCFRNLKIKLNFVDLKIINDDLTNFQKERVKKGIENEIPG
jgi:hypothetical protein